MVFAAIELVEKEIYCYLRLFIKYKNYNLKLLPKEYFGSNNSIKIKT